MTRLRYSFSAAAVMLMAVFVLAACGATPGTGTPGAGTPGIPNGDAAVAELCGTGQASLQNTATSLDSVNAETDETQLLEMIEDVRQPLNDAQVTGPAVAARDAANEALTQLESSMMDPQTRQAAATTAAGALRALNGVLCG